MVGKQTYIYKNISSKSIFGPLMVFFDTKKEFKEEFPKRKNLSKLSFQSMFKSTPPLLKDAILHSLFNIQDQGKAKMIKILFLRFWLRGHFLYSTFFLDSLIKPLCEAYTKKPVCINLPERKSENVLL